MQERIGRGQTVAETALGGPYTVFCARWSHYASQEAPKRTDQSVPVPADQTVARDFLRRAGDRIAAGWSEGGDVRLVWFKAAVGLRPLHVRFCHQPPASAE